VVRLIRSKGVGIYFVTQNPLDIPDAVLGQLGNRVQHALRAFTPRDQKAVRAAAETFRPKPGLDVAKAITELGVGEALLSVLDGSGTPTPVERALVCPPRSRLTPLASEERMAVIKGSVLYGHYEKSVDRESAYEKIKARAGQADAASAPPERGQPADAVTGASKLFGAMAKSAAHAIGSQIGRQVMRGVLGSLFGGGMRRRR
jgi:DNA helicase HerA-like ATPase